MDAVKSSDSRDQKLIHLMQRYELSVKRMCCAIVQDAALAEDAAQEALLRYHISEKQFESEQHIRAWLLRVAINCAKNVSRSFFRRNTVPLEDYMDSLEFDSGESREIFREVMNLPETYRLVIHLYYYEDYSVAEIGRILGLTESNVKLRLSRGRQKLKKALQEVWDDDQ